MGYGRPSTSRSVQPNIRVAAGFHVLTLSCVSSSMIATGEASISARQALTRLPQHLVRPLLLLEKTRSSSVRSCTRCSSSSRAPARWPRHGCVRALRPTARQRDRGSRRPASARARSPGACARRRRRGRCRTSPRGRPCPSPVDWPWRRKRAVIGNSVGIVKAKNAAITGASTGTEAMATPARTRARNICHGTDASEKNRMPAAPQPRPPAAAPATKRRHQASHVDGVGRQPQEPPHDQRPRCGNAQHVAEPGDGEPGRHAAPADDGERHGGDRGGDERDARARVEQPYLLRPQQPGMTGRELRGGEPQGSRGFFGGACDIAWPPVSGAFRAGDRARGTVVRIRQAAWAIAWGCRLRAKRILAVPRPERCPRRHRIPYKTSRAARSRTHRRDTRGPTGSHTRRRTGARRCWRSDNGDRLSLPRPPRGSLVSRSRSAAARSARISRSRAWRDQEALKPRAS